MPVRSLSSSVLKWPDARTVDAAVRDWAEAVRRARSDVVRIGYFGSYARGDWSVGSDVDLLIVVEDSDRPFEARTADWDATSLPVPADLLIYTRHEWESLVSRGGFHEAVQSAVWVYPE